MSLGRDFGFQWNGMRWNDVQGKKNCKRALFGKCLAFKIPAFTQSSAHSSLSVRYGPARSGPVEHHTQPRSHIVAFRSIYSKE